MPSNLGTYVQASVLKFGYNWTQAKPLFLYNCQPLPSPTHLPNPQQIGKVMRRENTHYNTGSPYARLVAVALLQHDRGV